LVVALDVRAGFFKVFEDFVEVVPHVQEVFVFVVEVFEEVERVENVFYPVDSVLVHYLVAFVGEVGTFFYGARELVYVFVAEEVAR